MKYIPLEYFTAINGALNFSTADTHVIGSCDIYTTKAAGSDRKLYKSIEQRLQAQTDSISHISASLSPPLSSTADDDNSPKEHDDDEHLPETSHVGSAPNANLSHPSPFGYLSQPGPRRTFAYLIATLNASHSNYDFSLALHPEDFKREHSLKRVMYEFDSTLRNLRPNKHLSPPTTYIAPFSVSSIATNSAGNEIWSPMMWSLIDDEMDLKSCEKYSYCPEVDPFEGAERGIMRMHYFFFNKERKRVCYLYFRTLSVISHSPESLQPWIRRSNANNARAYDGGIDTRGWEVDDGDEYMADEEGVDVLKKSLDDIRADLAAGNYGYDGPDYYDDEDLDFDEAAYEEEGWHRTDSSSYVRGVSEEIGEAMDMDGY